MKDWVSCLAGCRTYIIGIGLETYEDRGGGSCAEEASEGGVSDCSGDLGMCRYVVDYSCYRRAEEYTLSIPIIGLVWIYNYTLDIEHLAGRAPSLTCLRHQFQLDAVCFTVTYPTYIGNPLTQRIYYTGRKPTRGTLSRDF